MTRGVGYAPTAGKAKTIATPDVNRNNKPVVKSGDKKDKGLRGGGVAKKGKGVAL